MPTEARADLSRQLRGLNVYLIGMMGAGKSAVGRPLARALGYRFLDADTSLEQTAGRSISQIFAEEGEEGFRSLETAVLDQLAQWHSLVVATGGGVVTRPVNWGHLQQGVVVWLDAPETVLLARLRDDPTPRPLLADPDPARRLRQLLAERRPLYAQADLHVHQDLESPEEVASQILASLPGILRTEPLPPPEGVTLRHEDGSLCRSLNEVGEAGTPSLDQGGEGRSNRTANH